MNRIPNALLQAVERALDAIHDPAGAGLLSAGRILGLEADAASGRVRFTLEAPAGEGARYQAVRDAAIAAVEALAGVSEARVVLTEAILEKPVRPVGIIAVASAKGGVGKSTVSINLALALQHLGLKVGLLDADVFGPSIPTMLGTLHARPQVLPNKTIQPIPAFGLQTLSVGYLVNPEEPMIWRGAMVSQALRQLLEDGAWGEAGQPLDLLVLDLPPGTGDAHLTLAQRGPLAGAVIVSTPQEVALADVRRGIKMFERTAVPILGIIENMAYFESPAGERIAIFGEGGARRTALEFGVPFLGEIPLDMALRASGDSGQPLMAVNSKHAISLRFLEIAQGVINNLARAQRPLPSLRFV